MSQATPFHAGESEIQERLGVRQDIEPWARKVVRSFLPEEHREFYAGLPYLVIAARDERGRPWASIVVSSPGFAHSPGPGELTVDALPAAGDALDGALRSGDDVGVLGIELHTRRRNRVNGRVSSKVGGGFSLGVEQAFGNCPQYIHPRGWSLVSGERQIERLEHDRFSPELRSIVETADTFFIASGYRGEGEDPRFGMDASHRGGDPGFVYVADERTLLIPDYAGNNHFNTLGNLSLDPRAGLLFVDFEKGHTLQLTGSTFIEWPHPELGRFPGARRLLRFQLESAVELRDALPLRFDAASEASRELRLIAKLRESEDVTSFVFEARDGAALPSFAPGQHLPIEIEVAGEKAKLMRTYSLSSGPDDDAYRISVKREPQGRVSRHLHDRVEVGSIVTSLAPAGEFTLEHEGALPIVLLSAGVGLTPMVSMLRDLVQSQSPRQVVFVHGARDGAHHPLATEVDRLVEVGSDVRAHVAYSRPGPEDVMGRDYHSEGRVDATLLEKLVPGLDADYYLCGPVAFMAGVQEQLEQRGVPTEQIRSESFGPASA